MLSGLFGTLLPGGSGFPSARDLGVTQVFAARLGHLKPDPVAAFSSFLQAHGGLPRDEMSWVDIVRSFEAVEPVLFGELRKYAYLTYYEQPATIDAIRALGFLYNHAPLPEGYADEPFNPDTDVPRHKRGHWIATDKVERVDLADLRLET